MNKKKHNYCIYYAKFFIVAVLAVGCAALTACEPERYVKSADDGGPASVDEGGPVVAAPGSSSLFSGRAGHTSVVFDDGDGSGEKIWVIAGGSVGGLFKSSDDKKDVWSSGDGKIWTKVTAAASFPPREGHASVVHDNKMWVIGGSNNNDMWSSKDGKIWTEAKATSEKFQERMGHSGVVFQSPDDSERKIWVIGGFYLDKGFLGENPTRKEFGFSFLRYLNTGHPNITSTQWEASDASGLTSGAGYYTRRLTLWGLGYIGKNGSVGKSKCFSDVWNSSGGATWADAGAKPLTARTGHTSVAFNNKIWVIGGNNITFAIAQVDDHGKRNSVWSSSDGETWEHVLENSTEKSTTQFSARYGHTSVVFEDPDDRKEKMWVIGGDLDIFDKIGSKNDVWKSVDGKNWTEVTPADKDEAVRKGTLFPARAGHTSVVFTDPGDGKEKMWVIGGLGKRRLLNDVWSSSDGKTWKKMKPGGTPP